MVKATKEKEENRVATSHAANRQLTPEIQAEFQRIAAMDENKLIQAENVLKVAENTASPLHGFFEWDDDKAAYEWRLNQARYLIRSFQIEIEPLQVIPAFVSLGENRKSGGYSWGAEVYAQTDLRQNLLLTVLTDMENLLRKIEDMPEVQPLRQSILAIRTAIAQKGVKSEKNI